MLCRAIVRTVLALVLAVVAICSPLAAQAPGMLGVDTPTISRMPLLMPDDFSEMNLVAWRVERGTPDPQNPLIEGDMPWDAGGVGIHGSVFRDPIDSRWKAYLVCTPADFAPREAPWKSDNAAYRRLCLFESIDGVHWTRPELSNVSVGQHAKTNIIFDLSQGVAAYASIFVDPDDSQWPYTMIALREAQGSEAHGEPPQGNGYYGYRSKDGKAWEPMGKLQGPMSGDLAFFYRKPEGGFVSYYRIECAAQPTDHLPPYEDCARRSVFVASSPDGKTWMEDPDPTVVMTADELDHRDTQYQECAALKVAGGYLAMVTMYHPLAQTLDLRMAASRDGRHWWFPDRTACLENAPLGDYGSGMIWQSQNLIVQDKTLYVYYGGAEGAHRQISDTRMPLKRINSMEAVADRPTYFLPFNSALCRAAWRVDRMYALASSAGGPTVGAAVTTPRKMAGAGLWVNMRTRPPKKSSQPGFDEGYLQVELLGKDGKPLPGFSQADCQLLKGDHEAVQVKWAGGDRAPQDAERAKFYLKRVFLYGFEFRGGQDSVWQQK